MLIQLEKNVAIISQKDISRFLFNSNLKDKNIKYSDMQNRFSVAFLFQKTLERFQKFVKMFEEKKSIPHIIIKS